jgi:hypothetical protein
MFVNAAHKSFGENKSQRSQANNSLVDVKLDLPILRPLVPKIDA